MDALQRINGSVKRQRSSGLPVLGIAACGVVAVAASWAIGMKMGYAYAKKDAVYVLTTSNPYKDRPFPAWREWADSRVDYEPPADPGQIFDVFSVPLPGGDGITTADVYNGYQARLKRAYFSRKE